MAYTSDVIKNAVNSGFKVGLVSGKKIVRLYICHKCKCKSMITGMIGSTTPVNVDIVNRSNEMG